MQFGLKRIQNNFKIVHKLNLSFAFIVLMVSVLVIGSYISTNDLKQIFSEYREQARESLILANLVEDLTDARLAVLKYRLEDSLEFQNEVNNNIAEIVASKDRIAATVTNQEHLEKLTSLEEEALEYGNVFGKAAEQQEKRHNIVKQLDQIGPSIRSDLSEIMETAYRDNDTRAAYYAGRVQQHLMLMRLYAQKFLLQNHANDIKRVEKEVTTAIQLTDSLLDELQNPERRKLAANVIKGLKNYKANFDKVVTVINTRNNFYKNGLDKIGPKILAGYDELFEKVEKRQNTLGPQAVHLMEKISRTSMITGAILGLFVAAIAYLMGRYIAQSFALVIGQMERLSKGDKSFEIIGSERGDEIGDMGKALQVFRENALEVERLEEEQKAADKKLAAERRQSMLDMANVFEERVGSIVQTVEQAASDMQKTADQLTTAVQSTTTQSSNVASASQEASTNVQTVAAASEEMAASILEISRNVSDTALTAKNSAEAAQLSQKNLGRLQHAVDEVDIVIQSINEVAEQTNLLALNATIEAARAGDAGKGFAVVASEVKALANETHKMTDEIATKVEDIKSSASETISSMSDIIEQITSVDSKTASVAAAIEQQNAATAEISRNVQEAATGTNEVSRSIQSVQEAASDSSASTSQLKIASDNLAEQASQLKSAMEAFLSEVRAA